MSTVNSLTAVDLILPLVIFLQASSARITILRNQSQMDYCNMKFKYYYQRDMTWSSSDDNYKKQTSMMNDDSVSEWEIGLNKKNCGPVFKSWFSQKIQQIFKHHFMSQSQCFYASQYGRNTFKQLYKSALKWTSHYEMLQVKILNDISWNIKSTHTVNCKFKCAIYGIIFVFDWSIQY